MLITQACREKLLSESPSKLLYCKLKFRRSIAFTAKPTITTPVTTPIAGMINIDVGPLPPDEMELSLSSLILSDSLTITSFSPSDIVVVSLILELKVGETAGLLLLVIVGVAEGVFVLNTRVSVG